MAMLAIWDRFVTSCTSTEDRAGPIYDIHLHHIIHNTSSTVAPRLQIMS